MHEAQRAGVEQVGGEVAIRDGVERVDEARAHAEVGSNTSGIERQARTSERSGTEGRDIGGVLSCSKAADVSLQRPRVRRHVVRQRHGLGPLQVCKGGQNRGAVAFGYAHQCLLEVGDRELETVGMRATPESKRRGHLIVARATGVHTTAGISKHGDELAFDQRVHVFVSRTVVDRNLSEGVLDLRRFGSRDDALPAEHADVRL